MSVDLAAILADGTDFVRGETIIGRLTPRQEFRGVGFEDCTFKGCIIDEAILRNCDLVDCRFVATSLSQTKLPGTSFNDVTFSDCRAQSVDWSAAIPNQVSMAPLSFEGCKLTYSSFVNANLRRWFFQRCDLTDAEFGNATLTGARFVECNFTGARFPGADLRKLDLTASHGFVFDPRDAQVSGLKVRADDGAQLLRAFGIQVVD